MLQNQHVCEVVATNEMKYYYYRLNSPSTSNENVPGNCLVRLAQFYQSHKLTSVTNDKMHNDAYIHGTVL